MDKDRSVTLNKVYEALIHVALYQHPYEKIRPHVDESFMGYGTALDEKLRGWKEFQWMVDRQREELGKNKVTINRYPVQKSVFANDQSALIVEEIEFTVATEDGPHGFTMRLTTILEHSEDRWMIRHFHGSTADADTPEGNAWPIEEWKRRNAELQRVVEEKTADLLVKNEELEIEAALERIRASANAMKDSSELAMVIRIVFQEAISLGFGAKACDLVILDRATGGSEFWISGELDSEDVIHFKLPKLRNKHYLEGLEAWKKRRKLRSTDLKGRSCQTYMRQMMDNMYDSNMPPKAASFLKALPAVHHTEAYMRYGYFRVASVHPLKKIEENILKRFSHVFDQTYTRFLDLKKSEAQAREAQIEAALERVRSRSMAMHKSEELVEVATVLHNELRSLNVREFSETSIVVHDEPSQKLIVWGARTGSGSLEKAVFPLLGDQILQKLYDTWRRKEDFFTLKIEGAALQKHVDFVFPKASRTEQENEVIKSMPDPTFFHCAFYCMGYLELMSDNDLSEDSSSLLVRFAKVFDQAYTRFLDLKTAEAQAQEAQIEAALERVRACSMAMHNSDELQEVIKVVFDQINSLGLVMDSAQFDIFEEGSKDSNGWIATKEYQYAERVKTPYFKSPVFDTYLKAKRKKPSTYTMSFSKSEKDKYWKHVFKHTDLSKIPSKRKKYLLSSKGLDQTGAILNDLSLSINNYKGISYSEDETAIIKRFAEVFQQTYTRFLDLQKAEAQAREAQIEASLEKVRGTSMAMHKSEDLIHVANVMNQEFEKLGFTNSLQASFVLIDEEKKVQYLWGAQTDSHLLDFVTLPLLGDDVLQERYDAWKRKEAFLSVALTGEKRKMHLEVAMPLESLSEREKKGREVIPDPFHICCGFIKYGYLTIISSDSLADDQQRILARMAKVFEQTYTRFLDLQKAEAQAREAQIEVALERVRASTMAMHKSQELKEIVSVMYTEMEVLGLAKWGCNIMIFHEKSAQIEFWLAEETDTNHTGNYFAKGKEHPVYRKLWNHWKKQGPPLTLHHQDAYKREFDEYWLSKTDFKYLPDVVKKSVFDRNEVFLNYATMRYGMLNAISYVPVNNEMLETLARFAKVFEQAYTRFLDLQKAEAQVREAQIEAALERIRSRSMAMYDSEELGDVASLLYKELIDLGISNFFNCGFFIVKEEEGEQYGWLTQPEGAFEEKINLPYPGDTVLRNRLKAWKAKEPVFYQKVGGKTLSSHFKYVADRSHSQHQVETFMPFMPDPTYFYCGNFSEGYLHIVCGAELGEEAEAIIAQLTKVFEQTYTRFLDLQKAESQAREAQIEAALERVRTHTMAMHTSQDVGNTMALIFSELVNLGINAERNGILIMKEDENAELWTARPDSEGHIELLFWKIDMSFHQMARDAYTGWKHRELSTEYVLEGDDLKAYYEGLNNSPDYPGQFNLDKLPACEHCTLLHFPEGTLYIFTPDPVVEEYKQILIRFASVFGQTYRRYLDLQTAETQAREAQIEAALERIRGRAMAMHHSNELLDVAIVLRNEIAQLDNLQLESSVVHLYPEDSDSFKAWYSFHLLGTASDQLVNRFADFPVNSSEFTKEILKKYHSDESTYSIASEGKKLQDWYKVLDKVLPEVVEYDSKGKMIVPSILHYNFSKFSGGALMMVTHESIQESTRDLWRRAAQVFNITYQRFLDLQKAEIQTREAEIELALERVRARTMGMQKSEELKDVVKVIFDQLADLNIKAEHAGIVVDYEPKKDWHFWIAETQDIPAKVTVPYLDLVWDQQFTKAKREDKDFFTTQLDFEEKNSFYKELLPHIEGLTKKARDFYFSCSGLAISTVIQKDIGLYIENFSGTPYSGEENDILKRFGKVFQQTYTRFLDLKRAEEQAWEAQVEAALERVRSRTMAMQHSDELSETSFLLAQQVRELGINAWGCAFHIYADNEEGDYEWFSNEEGYLPFYKTPRKKFFKKFYEKRQNGTTLFIEEFKGKACADHYNYMMTLPVVGEALKSLIDSGKSLPTSQIDHILYFRHGYLLFITYDHIPESHEIFKRFTKEFEQTYTRFLDLQKAEAQAEEAQIEVALERIRARALAMQSSKELLEVASVMREQMRLLGESLLEASVIEFFEKSPDYFESWYSMRPPKGKGKIIDGIAQFYYKDSAIAREVLKAYRSPESEYTLSFSGKKFAQWLETFKVRAPDIYKSFGKNLPKQHVYNYADFTGGTLVIVSHDQPSPKSKELLKRTSAAFDLAYKRYLDLKTAESQAREAQIEAALERVRARSMAMHNSNELKEVAAMMYEQMEPLELAKHGCEIILCDEENDQLQFWSTNAKQTLLPERYDVDRFSHPFFRKQWKAWKQKQDRLVITNEGKVKRDFDNFIFTKTDFRKFPDHVKKFIRTAKKDVFTHAIMKFGLLEAVDEDPLSEEKFQVLGRFAKVFEQTYTRFLDLQRAEAQARESQIEAALERIRAKAMAMHNSEDVGDATTILFKELQKLGIETIRCGVGIYKDQDMEIWSAVASKKGEMTLVMGQINMKIHPVLMGAYHSWKAGDLRYSYKLKSKDLQSYYRAIYNQPDYRLPHQDIPKIEQSFQCTWYPEGGLYAMTKDPLTKKSFEIFDRFGKVFQLTYRRYLDLKEAEAKAKEAQIEASLERVRARSMAMHKTEELWDVINVVFSQFELLGIKLDTCHINVFDKESKDMNIWVAADGETYPEQVRIPYINHPVFKKQLEARKNREAFYEEKYSKKVKDQFFNHFFQNAAHIKVPARRRKKVMEGPGLIDSVAISNHFAITVSNYGTELYTNEENKILQRISKVFEQTYTRFLDLQKAEAQAREAQIEVALEKVRSRTMGMQSSEELPEVANLLFFEIQSLGIPAWSCGYNILSTDKKSATCWMSSEGALQKPFTLRLFGEDSFDEMGKFINSKKTTLVQELGGKALGHHYDYMKSFPDLMPTFKALEEEGLSLPTYQINHLCKFSHGFLLFITYEPVPDSHELFTRFTNVFEQTYTRFLDLKKAEEQAREAQIEVALERVRARASAMHKADELKEVAMELRTQMALLGQKELEVCGIHLYEVDEEYFESWGAMRPEGSSQIIQGQSRFPKKGVTIIEEMLKYYISGKRDYVLVNEGEKAAEFFNMMKEYAPDVYKHFVTLLNKIPSQERIAYWSLADFKGGSILMVTYNPPEEDSRNLLRRVANVFDLAYRRFLDLRKAEAQAREAQIETALERIRARALAMHDSSELDEVVSEMRKQMALLGQVQLETIAIHLYPEEGDEFESWYAIRSPHKKKGKVLTGTTRFSKKDTAVARKMLSLYHSNKSEYKMELQGKILDEWQEMAIDRIPGMEKEWGDNMPIYQYWYFADFSGGSFVLIPREEPNEEAKELLRRSSSVFDLAYRRYLDLQSTEAREKEAIKQASLDRVRAEIASMRTTDDLNRITPLVWRELTTLGVPFFRCGLVIVDEQEEMVRFFLSNPEGKPFAALKLKFDAELVANILEDWRRQLVYTDHWDREQFIGFTQSLIDQGQIDAPRGYQGGESPPESLTLQFVPFEQGMLYVGSVDALDGSQIDLVHALADAFSVAYARYEDFQQLEKAKERVEGTLNELKSTQDQLVHSEKMASLGELTAGIAHEIQNPLNFVNNFSDINKELAEELMEEIKNGNGQEVEAIVKDIIENEEKILHHGQRAEEIVRSMLLHSRGSTGEKELTDINALADEYMRLAFHGMRAKDKSFNADFQLDLEEELPKLNVLQQDIGRVLLNLINNAFYATNEKSRKSKNGQDYKPVVSLTTKLVKNSVEITVKDNGSGIPNDVVDKIFQPFYTTKPTGQGTGLGLSLSFDIITKGHGGTINVKSKVDKGTEFIITLPIV